MFIKFWSSGIYYIVEVSMGVTQPRDLMQRNIMASRDGTGRRRSPQCRLISLRLNNVHHATISWLPEFFFDILGAYFGLLRSRIESFP
jgi:uncharacterized membrane protein SpoIIM required for sporulation